MGMGDKRKEEMAYFRRNEGCSCEHLLQSTEQKQHLRGRWDPLDSLQTQRPEGSLMARKRDSLLKTLGGPVGDSFLHILIEI